MTEESEDDNQEVSNDDGSRNRISHAILSIMRNYICLS
jgi:hypothetical protein